MRQTTQSCPNRSGRGGRVGVGRAGACVGDRVGGRHGEHNLARAFLITMIGE